MNNDNLNSPVSDFTHVYKGKLYGILRWNQLDDLWGKVTKDSKQGWYLYAVGEDLPVLKTTGNDLIIFIDEVNQLLRRDHKEYYCGIVYADSIESPSLIKVFDPNNIGTSCSISKNPPPPAWVISKMIPQKIDTEIKQTVNRQRWWQNIFKTKDK